MTSWTAAIVRLYEKSQRDRGLVYGNWGVAHDGDDDWNVVDLSGTVVVKVTGKALADLIATLPDLCDPDLRQVSDVVWCEVSGDREKVPATGIESPQEAFDKGFRQGFSRGSAKGYEIAVADLAEEGEEE
tara:strand:- start:1243 stop:1632 length:390 start_codon:yes stop_codon:yes gene_type:complete